MTREAERKCIMRVPNRYCFPGVALALAKLAERELFIGEDRKLLAPTYCVR